MSIYHIILNIVLVLVFMPPVYAVFDRISAPYRYGKGRFYKLITALIDTLAVLAAFPVYMLITFLSSCITDDFLKVIVYTVILSAVASDKLYMFLEEKSKLKTGVMWFLNKTIFTVLPTKSLLYAVSTVCFIMSQLQNMGMVSLSGAWKTFFSYHEFSLFIVFSVDEIISLVPVDMKRFRENISILAAKAIKGIDPAEYGYGKETEHWDVYISCASGDKKIRKSIMRALGRRGIVCRATADYHYSAFLDEMIERMERCKVCVIIISREAMENADTVHELMAAYKLFHENKMSVTIYKICEEPYTDFVESFTEDFPQECFVDVKDGTEKVAERVIKELSERIRNGE